MTQAPEQLNGLDLMNFMVKQEEQTAALYREIASNAKLGDGFFDNLAKDEDRHRDIYAALVRRFEKDTENSFHQPVSEEDYHYLQSFVENDPLKDHEDYLKDASKIGDRMDIYNLAIRLEQETVALVTELKRLYQDVLPGEFDVIINEEKKHLQQVRQRRYDYGISGRGL